MVPSSAFIVGSQVREMSIWPEGPSGISSSVDQVLVDDGYVGEGYGIPAPSTHEAIAMTAQASMGNISTAAALLVMNIVNTSVRA